MFSRREKVLLTLAALAVAAAVVIQLSGGVAGSARADDSRDVAQWQALHKRVAEMDTRLRQITIPTSQATAHLLRAAQASGSGTGVAITSARPRRPTETSFGCLEQALEIQAVGSFPSIARFMFDLEAKNTNLRITRVAVTSSDDSSDEVHSAIIIAGYSPGEVKK